MEFSGVCLITESVPSLVGFYKNIFECEPEHDEDHADFSLEGLHLSIFSKKGMDRMAIGSMENAGYGSITLGFEVNDVDAEYERIKSLNVNFVMLPTTHPWGCRSFWFRDPDRNIIDFSGSAPSQ